MSKFERTSTNNSQLMERIVLKTREGKDTAVMVLYSRVSSGIPARRNYFLYKSTFVNISRHNFICITISIRAVNVHVTHDQTIYR